MALDYPGLLADLRHESDCLVSTISWRAERRAMEPAHPGGRLEHP